MKVKKNKLMILGSALAWICLDILLPRIVLPMIQNPAVRSALDEALTILGVVILIIGIGHQLIRQLTTEFLRTVVSAGRLISSERAINEINRLTNNEALVRFAQRLIDEVFFKPKLYMFPVFENFTDKLALVNIEEEFIGENELRIEWYDFEIVTNFTIPSPTFKFSKERIPIFMVIMSDYYADIIDTLWRPNLLLFFPISEYLLKNVKELKERKYIYNAKIEIEARSFAEIIKYRVLTDTNEIWKKLKDFGYKHQIALLESRSPGLWEKIKNSVLVALFPMNIDRVLKEELRGPVRVTISLHYHVPFEVYRKKVLRKQSFYRYIFSGATRLVRISFELSKNATKRIKFNESLRPTCISPTGSLKFDLKDEGRVWECTPRREADLFLPGDIILFPWEFVSYGSS